MSGEESEHLVVPVKRGNRLEGPRRGKGVPRYGTDGGTEDGDTELHDHLHETRSDSEAGEGETGRGSDHAGASHRRRLAARSLPAHAQGRRDGRGRTNGRAVC